MIAGLIAEDERALALTLYSTMFTVSSGGTIFEGNRTARKITNDVTGFVVVIDLTDEFPAADLDFRAGHENFDHADLM
ncbi:hypothetical protein D3C71_1839480 [compost metagenome]